MQLSVEVHDPSASVRGDPFLLRQALSNLLDNAIAFSPDGNLVGARSATGGDVGGTDQGALYIWRAPSWAEIEALEKADKVAR